MPLADALYVGLAESPLYKYGVSLNKLYDYMMAGRPVIYGVRAANNEVEEAVCGLTVPPADVESLAEAIKRLSVMDNEKREIMGNNGKSWVLKNCEYGKLAKKFLEACVSK